MLLLEVKNALLAAYLGQHGPSAICVTHLLLCYVNLEMFLEVSQRLEYTVLLCREQLLEHLLVLGHFAQDLRLMVRE